MKNKAYWKTKQASKTPTDSLEIGKEWTHWLLQEVEELRAGRLQKRACLHLVLHFRQMDILFWALSREERIIATAQMRDRTVVVCYGPASGTFTDTEYIILCETGPSLLVGMWICAANMEIGMQVLQNTELIYEPANTIPGYIPEGIKLATETVIPRVHCGTAHNSCHEISSENHQQMNG